MFPYRTVIEQSVSNTATVLAKQFNTQFQLALGDNFYTNGVQNEYDSRFKVNLIFFLTNAVIYADLFLRIRLKMFLRIKAYKHLGSY